MFKKPLKNLQFSETLKWSKMGEISSVRDVCRTKKIRDQKNTRQKNTPPLARAWDFKKNCVAGMEAGERLVFPPEP